MTKLLKKVTPKLSKRKYLNFAFIDKNNKICKMSYLSYLTSKEA